MKTIKKLSVLSLSLIMLFVLAACGGGNAGGTGTASTPIPEGTDTGLGLSVAFPEGFAEAATSPLTYAAEDGSSVNVVTTDKDPGFSDYTEDYFAGSLSTLYQSMLGEDSTYEIDSFKFSELNGTPALTIKATITFQGGSFKQTQVMLDGDKTYTVTLTDMSQDASWQSAFDSSIASIALI